MLTINDLSKEVDMTAVRGGTSLVGQVDLNVGDCDRRFECDRDDEERHERHERHEGWHRRCDQKFDIASCGSQS